MSSSLRPVPHVFCIQPHSPKQGMRPCNGTILKSSVSASIPKSQTLAASQSQPSPAVAVAVVAWLLAVHETSVLGASECLVLIQELLLSPLDWPLLTSGLVSSQLEPQYTDLWSSSPPVCLCLAFGSLSMIPCYLLIQYCSLLPESCVMIIYCCPALSPAPGLG